VLANLDQWGFRYVIWDRSRSAPEAWRSLLLSTQFLREHSRFLAGDGNAYLFEILPDGGLTWGVRHPRNQLADSGLETVGREGSPWTIVGSVKARHGLVSMGDESAIAQQVPVSGGTPYLLTAKATCTDPTKSAELRLRWFDDDGATINIATESVIPGIEGSEQFLWRRAPDQAASVAVELASGRCSFDEVALLALS
jgi:hypothetical protein